MMTAATTGTTSTSAAVAMLRCDRSGSMARPKPNESMTPTVEPTNVLRTLPLSYGNGDWPGGTRSIEDLFRATGRN